MKDGMQGENVLFETIVDGAILIDLEGKILQFNPACERIFGYTPVEVIGKNVKMLMPGPYRDEHDDYISNYLATGDAKVIGIGREVQGVRKDGSIFDMELSVGQSRQSDPPYFVGIIRDITERREAEAQIVKSEARFRAMFDTAVDGMIIIDEFGSIELFNPACVDLFGYEPEEVVGQNVKMLMPEPYKREHDQYLRNYLTSGKAQIIGVGREVRGARKDGSKFDMELAVGASEVDGRPFFVGIVRDITERREAEVQLKESEAKFRAMFETAVDGIIIIDDHGTIQLFNPACTDIFGYESGEVVGNNVNMLMPEPYRGEHDTYLQNYLLTGAAKIIGQGREVRGRRKDGTTFPMDLSVGQGGGDYSHIFVGVVRDITARVDMETEYANQVAQTKEALERERQVNEMQQEFLTMATHEFRTPLAVIDASAQRLASQYADMLEMEEFSKRLGGIRTNVERMTSLLESTLQLSKADSGELKLERKVLDIVRLCDRIVHQYADLHGADRVTFRSLEPGLEIWADPSLIERIIENLVSNACKYTPAEAAVLVSVESDGIDALIRVIDNGPGIPSDDCNRIFDRFYRGKDTQGTSGTGLGLYMCRKFARLHKGEVTVQSIVGQGSTFEVRLPVKAT